MAAGLPKFMTNKRTILILAVVAVAVIAQTVIFCSKPKVEFDPQAEVSEQKTALTAMVQEPLKADKKANISDELINTASVDIPAEICLNLELVGTAVGNAKDPIAFIKDLSTNKQGIYKTGYSVGDARVVYIAKGFVDLDLNGRKICLNVKDRKNQIAPSATGAIVSVSGNEIVMSRMALLNEAGNILNLAKQVKIRPYKQETKVVGMKFAGVAKGSVIEQAGIHDNDVLTAINNQKIDSYQKALQVFNKIKNQKEIKVTLLRDGCSKQLSYKINN